MDAAFEVLKDGHGLLRELPGVRVWGVDDGALVLGEDATHFVFCHQGALTVRQNGAWPHVLALALSERLGLNVLQQAGPGVVVVYGLAQRAPSWTDVDVWAWVDLTPEQQLQSVMKVTPGTLVLMPWQDATAACARPFVAGFDD